MLVKIAKSTFLLTICIFVAFIKTDDLISPTKQCPANQTYKTEGHDCFNCALFLAGIEVKCPPENISKCYCKDDYIRVSRTNNSCVLREDCPQTCTKPFEVYTSKCGCELVRSCQNPRPEICLTVCELGCFCKTGYIKDTRIDRCVRRHQCSLPGKGN